MTRLGTITVWYALAVTVLSATAFLAPTSISVLRGPSSLKLTHGNSHAHRIRPSWVAARHGSRYTTGRRDVLFGGRGRRTVTVPSMTFGGGGFGGGGRPSKGPFGLDAGTLSTLIFALLLIFAPGVIFGVFNTLFLVVTLGPLLLTLGINIYTRLNTVDAPCPVCGVQLEGFKNSQNECPSCGSMLITNGAKFETMGSGYIRDEDGKQQEYSRVGDSGVIDVDAVSVDD